MIRKLAIIFTFILGLSIFSYPIISHWIKTKEHYTIISEHNEMLEQMSEEEKLNEREKAEQYNNELSESSILIEDPFDTNETENAHSSYYNVLNIGETIGHLEIPEIDVNLPIYHGISDDVLQQGVGHMSNSSFPIGGEGSHTALTAHRGLPSTKLFRDLDKLEIDDIIYLKTLGETLAYQVDDIQIVLPSETNWLSIEEDKDYVTLITCEPYMINTHRLLVRGERVPYEDDKPEEIAQQSEPINQNHITSTQLSDSENEETMNFKFNKFTVVIFVIILFILGYSIKSRLQKRDVK